MTADEFNETFALCHFLPGPNIVNLSVVFGSRFRGIRRRRRGFRRAGRSAHGTSLTILAALYARFGEIDALRRDSGRRVLRGSGSAASGRFPDDDAADQTARC